MSTPETKICKGALVKGIQEGNVKFGYGCMVHPFAKILTEGNCTITFGDYNIIAGVLDGIQGIPRFI